MSSIIETSQANIELIKDWPDWKSPLRLKSYSIDDEAKADLKGKLLEDDSWRHGNPMVHNLPGMVKFIYERYDTNIEFLDEIRSTLLNKLFNRNRIAVWVSEENATGTDWHLDIWKYDGPDEPACLFCMNIEGETLWKFDGYEDMVLREGDCIIINGSVKHKVEPLSDTRITFAGYGGLYSLFAGNSNP